MATVVACVDKSCTVFERLRGNRPGDGDSMRVKDFAERSPSGRSGISVSLDDIARKRKGARGSERSRDQLMPRLSTHCEHARRGRSKQNLGCIRGQQGEFAVYAPLPIRPVNIIFAPLWSEFRSIQGSTMAGTSPSMDGARSRSHDERSAGGP